jgi:hypothetical protein
MERDPLGEGVVCWLCNNGLLVLGVLTVLIVASSRIGAALAPISLTLLHRPSLIPTGTLRAATTASLMPTATRIAFQPTPNDSSLASSPTSRAPALTEMSTPISFPRPEYVLVFIPLSWGSGMDAYRQAASQQAGIFTRESGITDYFKVQVKTLSEGPTDVTLDDPDLLQKVIAYGLAREPGDRYIGLTDGDLVSNGDPDVLGWTAVPGTNGLVAEAGDPYVTAHELGHTFGLCDEYSYIDWTSQNNEFPDGCPNPYPPDCPTGSNPVRLCQGSPILDGRNSIMGPGGMPGEYGFNEACKAHLLELFAKDTAGIGL